MIRLLRLVHQHLQLLEACRCWAQLGILNGHTLAAALSFVLTAARQAHQAQHRAGPLVVRCADQRPISIGHHRLNSATGASASGGRFSAANQDDGHDELQEHQTGH